MKKTTKSKQAPKTDIYASLMALTKPHTMQKIVVDLQDKLHIFKDESVPVPAEISISSTFTNFDKFSDLPAALISELHKKYFGVVPPKDQNPVTSASWVWAYMIKHATPHLANTDPVTGEKERKSSNAKRGYRLTDKKLDVGEIKTFQAIQCYKILYDLIATCDPQDPAIVSEELLKNTVERRAAELKTKQDPWRIFQYYRPKLVSLGYIKHD